MEIITFRPVRYGIIALTKRFEVNQKKITRKVGQTTAHLQKNLHKTAKKIVKTTKKAIKETKKILEK